MVELKEATLMDLANELNSRGGVDMYRRDYSVSEELTMTRITISFEIYTHE